MLFFNCPRLNINKTNPPKNKTDYGQEDWCGNNHDVSLTPPLGRLTPNLPMPTLYSADGQRKPKLSIVEVVLYNMASMLASVASGYDVRMSNVSPLHPKLQPHTNLVINDVDEENVMLNDDQFHDHHHHNQDYSQVDRRYAHNTYHGPVKHTR